MMERRYPTRTTRCDAKITGHYAPRSVREWLDQNNAFTMTSHGNCAWCVDETLRVVGITGGFVSEALG